MFHVIINILIFNMDPVIFHLGPLEIRYYGLLWALTIIIGYQLWIWQANRAGIERTVADSFPVWAIIGTIIGARLGHCLFYDFQTTLSNPLSVLYIWRGGLASHGATAGLLLATFIFTKKHNLKFIDIVDRLVFVAAVGAILIRIGNFINSEVVGRATDLPWGVKFIRYDNGLFARHPSQLYESLFGVFLLIILLKADKYFGKEKRPKGLLTGLFLFLYFLFRFLIEYLKEYQTLSHSYLTMGQYLSIVPILVGIILLIQIALKHKAMKKNMRNM